MLTMRAPSFSLLKGMSENSCVYVLAELFAKLESSLHTSLWISRVPSKRNIADPPSRGIKNVPFLISACDESAAAAAVELDKLVAQFYEVGEMAERPFPHENGVLAFAAENGSQNKQV